MHVFITGANGFIGRALAERLTARGDVVTGVDLVPGPGVEGGDITKPGAWQDGLAGADVVVHTAAIVSNAAGMDAQWRVNTVGTRRVLDAAGRAGVSRFVLLSSVRAFSDTGFPDGVTEDHPVRPDGNPYVDTKIACEQVALQAHAAGEIEAVIVRPGDVYGPGCRPWTVLPVELIRKNRFVLPAMGNGVFSPVYIDDLVDGLLLAAWHPGAAGQVFTLSGGTGVTCKEFFGYYHRMLGKRGPLVVPTAAGLPAVAALAALARVARVRSELNPVSLRYLTRTGTYSIAKARRTLGYQPAVVLADGMALTREWLAARGLVPTG
ncbi:dTDP-glucose 4,6-dehydratase [Actinomadura rubteroloni]|uniref:dTDP-glucose 4,6-dehydratase n=1 Tax=Actinomadura rubteroloni TaxID=1926885 RepID=A0A2P4UN13_9ACTN|nr:NAD-dependent epimerase/dehydratase family protein [Actinomadura rubteroloni]POM26440.1 dTDP-glucose 4,6-dehydratase [Actinomadura rubteroloni]